MEINFDPDHQSPTRSNPDLGPEFIAQFDSTCTACGGGLLEGDSARYFEGEAMHADCAESEARHG